LQSKKQAVYGEKLKSTQHPAWMYAWPAVTRSSLEVGPSAVKPGVRWCC
jgi:hypothetical protein